MNTDVLDELVLDALYYRQATPPGSCFVSNAAGLELIKCDSSVLAHIERTLRDVVWPASSSSIPDEFLGIDYLLGAYAIIASHYNPARTIGFVRGMPTSVQLRFVSILALFFNNRDAMPAFRESPADAILAYVDGKFFAQQLADFVKNGRIYKKIMQEGGVRAYDFQSARRDR